MGAPIRVGIVGCGSVAQLLHLLALAHIPDRFRETALCDISPKALDGVGARWNMAQRFIDPAALLSGAAGSMRFRAPRRMSITPA